VLVSADVSLKHQRLGRSVDERGTVALPSVNTPAPLVEPPSRSKRSHFAMCSSVVGMPTLTAGSAPAGAVDCSGRELALTSQPSRTVATTRATGAPSTCGPSASSRQVSVFDCCYSTNTFEKSLHQIGTDFKNSLMSDACRCAHDSEP
jgi:hypothetical protein